MGSITRVSKAILAIGLSIISFTVCSRASAKVDYEELKRGVVKITAQKPENVRDTGAGIVVGIEENIALILTALHVVTFRDAKDQFKEAPKIEVVFFDRQYRKFEGKLFWKYHEDLDIALITVDPEVDPGGGRRKEGRRIPSGIPRFTLGDISKLREGQKVSIIGHPPGLEDWQASINVNTIAGLSDQEDFRKFRFTKIGIDRGNSGGPVFDERGALIGMATQITPIHAVAVKIEDAVVVLRKKWGISSANLTPPLAFGKMVVTSKPFGAQVFLDGQPVGTTAAGPLHIEDLEGRQYFLRVTKDGYTPWEESVEVEPGQERSILVTLELAAPPAVQKVELLPAKGSIMVGKTMQLRADLKDTKGNPLHGRSVNWSSSSPAIATVSAGGLVTGITPGNVMITASSEGVIGTATILVTGGQIIVRANTNPSVAPAGTPIQITVQALSSQGTPIPQADVKVSAGGGIFAESGAHFVVGRTGSNGVFRTTWSCQPPCSRGYGFGIEVSKPGYTRVVAEAMVSLEGGQIVVRANTNPPVAPAGTPIQITVQALSSQGAPIPQADVKVSAGGGVFAESGAHFVVGRTGSNGVFRTTWSCRPPCSRGYGFGIEVSKPGYAKGVGQTDVRLH